MEINKIFTVLKEEELNTIKLMIDSGDTTLVASNLEMLRKLNDVSIDTFIDKLKYEPAFLAVNTMRSIIKRIRTLYSNNDSNIGPKRLDKDAAMELFASRLISINALNETGLFDLTSKFMQSKVINLYNSLKWMLEADEFKAEELSSKYGIKLQFVEESARYSFMIGGKNVEI